jgi:glycerol-3-phosphate acyltransferase PlsY
MPPAIVAILFVVGAYLLGAVPFGFLIARARGVDIQKQGSGNIGATNVGRVLGRRFGVLVFLLDFAKGAVPAGAGLWLGNRILSGTSGDALGVAAGLAAFLGHLYPIYLRFQGGKGVATGAGVVAVLLPIPAFAALLTWVGALCAFRYVSLASLAAVVALCACRLAITPARFAPEKVILTLFCFVAAALVSVRHWANARRLIQGNENRIQEGKEMLLLTKTVHVLALGLWFGSGFFFSFVAAPLIFSSYGALIDATPEDRPAFLPASLTKENANQLGGLAVGPLFPWYFLLQGTCALLALATAWAWISGPGRKGIHSYRFLILALALATIIAGWPLARYVGDLRQQRYSPSSEVAHSAQEQFGRWHGYSLMLNFVTLGLVTVAMGMAARLPEAPSGR